MLPRVTLFVLALTLLLDGPLDAREKSIRLKPDPTGHKAAGSAAWQSPSLGTIDTLNAQRSLKLES